MVLPLTFVQVCFFLSVVAFGPNLVSCMTVYCAIVTTNVLCLEHFNLYNFVWLYALIWGRRQVRPSAESATQCFAEHWAKSREFTSSPVSHYRTKLVA